MVMNERNQSSPCVLIATRLAHPHFFYPQGQVTYSNSSYVVFLFALPIVSRLSHTSLFPVGPGTFNTLRMHNDNLRSMQHACTPAIIHS